MPIQMCSHLCAVLYGQLFSHGIWTGMLTYVRRSYNTYPSVLSFPFIHFNCTIDFVMLLSRMLSSYETFLMSSSLMYFQVYLMIVRYVYIAVGLWICVINHYVKYIFAIHSLFQYSPSLICHLWLRKRLLKEKWSCSQIQSGFRRNFHNHIERVY